MPETYWGPEQLNHEAWVEFAARLEPAAEIELLLDQLAGCESIIDVGGGTGTLTRAVAERFGRCTVVEPSAAQAAAIEAAPGSIIDIVPGRGEAIPFSDAEFDAAVATWVLQYTDDPDAAVGELARVSRGRVLIVQAAPQNQLVAIYNAEAAVAGHAPAHHGYLLCRAADILADRGFANITLHHCRIPLRFDGVDAADAAALLQRLHFSGHPAAAAMRAATTPLIASMLAATPGELDDSGVMLVASMQ